MTYVEPVKGEGHLGMAGARLRDPGVDVDVDVAGLIRGSSVRIGDYAVNIANDDESIEEPSISLILAGGVRHWCIDYPTLLVYRLSHELS